jgi:hypothetical protein
MLAIKLDEGVAVLALQNIFFVFVTSTALSGFLNTWIYRVHCHRPYAKESSGRQEAREEPGADPLCDAI